MNQLKNILVGIDYSDSSDSALREAARIADWDGARLVAVHVIDSEILKDLERAIELDRGAILVRGKQRLLQRITEVLGTGRDRDLHAEVVTGHPFGEFAHAAERSHADLVVLGSHGGATADPHRVGILAERCLRKLGQNVLLVRSHQSAPFRRVVACIDFSETSHQAALQAVHIAIQDGARVEFLHVRHPVGETLVHPDFYTGTPAAVLPNYDQTLADQLRNELQEMAEQLAAEHSGLDYEVTVLQQPNPQVTIVNYVNQSGADLVVLGTRGHTTLRNLLLGSTAEKILSASRCSALAVKPHGFEYALK